MALTLITPKRYTDARGWFSESYNGSRFAAWDLEHDWCQDNHSSSTRAGTLRGLHFQTGSHAQSKLVRCLRGAIYDVAVDLRPDSPSFKQWRGFELSAETAAQLLIPVGFAHGFLTLTYDCEVAYKVDAYYDPEADGGVAWDDAELAIDWPMSNGITTPHLSEKDRALPKLSALSLAFPYDGRPLAVREVVQ